MRLYEYEGAALFAREGISVPESRVITTPTEARQTAEQIGLPVVLKAQVLAGGRGLAGGVRAATTLEEVEATAAAVLEASIRGIPVRKVLVARKVEIERELYASVVLDGYEGRPRAILGAVGGVSIEELVRTHPDRIVSKAIPVSTGLRMFEARQMAKQAGLSGRDMLQVAGILHSLYLIFWKYDATLVEINPLARTSEGTYVALDAKVDIDDSSIGRHPELGLDQVERGEDPLERRGREIGVTYVDLDGDVGIISSGAGLGMATMDIVGRKCRPANFLETGGAITEELLYQAMDLVFQKPLKGVFINLYGGINPIHEGAKGVVRYVKEHSISLPIVAKALGNRQEETWEILRSGGVHVVTDVQTESGVDVLFRLIDEGAR